jgi:hypothetical protein
VVLLISGSLAGCSSDEESVAAVQATPTATVSAGLQPTASAGPQPTVSAEPQSTATAGEVEPCATSERSYIEVEYEEWVLSTEEIVKHVDDVYVGTVLSAGETFSRNGSSIAWTPFTVEVEQRLLGSVEGTITVVQMGGCNPDRNVLYIVGSDPLLEVGETYMFASRTGRNNRPEEEGQHFVAAFRGRVWIQDEAHRQQLIQEYTEAINKAGLGS